MASPAWLAAGARTGRDAFLTPLALALAGVRAVIARPAPLAALAVLLVCVPSPNGDVTASVHVTAPDVGTVALVAAVLAGVLPGLRRGGPGTAGAGGGVLPPSRLWLGVGAAVVAFAVSAIGSLDPVGSLTGFLRYTQLFVVVPVAVAMSLRSRADIRLVCAAVLVAALVEAAVGTVQYVSGTGASYGGRNVRAVGTFSALDVMGMATVVGYGIVVALGLGLVLRGRARLALLAVAAALVVPLLLTLSRGALVSTVAAAAVVVLVAGRRVALPAVVYGGAVAVLLSGVVGGGVVVARFATIGTATSTPDRSVQDRYDLWQAATGMWRDHPVTGVGLKEFAAYRDSYAPLRLSSGSDVADPALAFQREPLLSPHNMYLLVLSEQGLVGLVGLFGLLFGVAAVAVRRALAVRQPAGPGRGAGPPDGRLPDGRLASLAAVGIIAWTLVDFLYGDIGGPSTLLMSVLLGIPLWWATRPVSEPDPGPSAGWAIRPVSGSDPGAHR